MGALLSLGACLTGGEGAPPVVIAGRKLVWKAPLAEGACSFIELRADAVTGELAALKRVVMREDGDGDPRLEAELLAAFDHPHIVRLLGTAVLPPTSERPLPELLISMELCGGGRLPEALARRGGRRFEEAEVRGGGSDVVKLNGAIFWNRIWRGGKGGGLMF
ncbi:hypothetical protein T492DRAFT_1138865 [Pavlovales sp. CCMP2436]|nr:hypothetical protein T492DRAFT_1138865 [Pavlovales sp. CCMP2436]